MKQLLCSALVFSLIFTACGERTVGTSRLNTVAPAPAPAAPVKLTTPAMSPLASPGKPSINTITNTAKLNPAHGQPGHRCDIAVGAPLPADNAATSVQQALPAVNNAIPQAAPATVGLNPAHGQPGHRCDIAVGAPLDSKPASK